MVAGRWVIAFDSSCCRCRAMADEVKGYAGSRLDVMPLDDPRVQAWRTQALGSRPPHAPTLIRVADREAPVRAWTGWPMGVRLALRLGPRSTARLLRALGSEGRAPDVPAEGMGRGRFVRLAGLGVVAAVLGGGPVSEASAASPAEKWVEANRARLPREYEAFAAHEMSYRQAIFAALAPADRSRLWLDHLTWYRASRPDLTAEQRRVLDRAQVLFGRESTFTGSVDATLHQELESLRKDAVAALGQEEGRAALATLGPVPAAPLPGCGCSCVSDWCSSSNCVCCVRDCWCQPKLNGCGTAFAYMCTGTCGGVKPSRTNTA
ncbi:bacteriocin fulvocin C-related protein [Streptomyces sp. HU2014]|uniref:bacteriocin fulvocin C-related protein n=1 Tax=Streptomyces sp. HU2014 TaxID=2939414 RepID=UPI00200F33CB|nr:bacteriocin fulvocin C-related protein [Streptomyces sp. HU2014]UQI45851.1 bacteriocin fulvocin C-related protein [Streptomyces sp. HU2014]